MRTPSLRLWHLVLATMFSFFLGWYFQGFQRSPSTWTNIIRNPSSSNGVIPSSGSMTCSNEEMIRSRIEESESIWSKGVLARHAAEVESPISDDKPWEAVNNRLIWDFFYPNYNCPHTVERIGRVGDGGKWVCGLSQLQKRDEPCVVYSYGVSGDTSFEEEMLTRTNCTLYAYDHTVDEEKVKVLKLFPPSRVSFFKLGIGKENKGALRTLKSEMDQRGHDFIDVLKVDVEGAEFRVLRQIMSDFPNALPFGQLLIELHLGSLPQNGLFKHVKTWWEKLEAAGLRAFHNEPNLLVVVRGFKNPAFYEVSFLNVAVDNAVLHA